MDIFLNLEKLQIFMFIFIILLFSKFGVGGIKNFYFKILVLVFNLIVSIIFYSYIEALRRVDEFDLDVVIWANIVFSLMINVLAVFSMKSIFSKKIYEYILCVFWFCFISVANWDISVAIGLLIILTTLVQLYKWKKN